MSHGSMRTPSPGDFKGERFCGNLTLPDKHALLIGRDQQFAQLENAWTGGTRVVQIIGLGGIGKTALATAFARRLSNPRTFGWSFHNEGTAFGRAASDAFVSEILKWLDLNIPPYVSVYGKVDSIVSRLGDERVLLMLDGIEELLAPDGSIIDLPLKALLEGLATSNSGLTLCTTRMRLQIPDSPPRLISMNLEDLTDTEGAVYLRRFNVRGTDEELRAASREFRNHALALTLLGTYLEGFCDGDVHRRADIPPPTGRVTGDLPVRRMLAEYERVFSGTPEAAIIRALGYFNRPAEPYAMQLAMGAVNQATRKWANLKDVFLTLFPWSNDKEQKTTGFRPIEKQAYDAAIGRLSKCGLVFTSDPDVPIDSHPLVRQYFLDEMVAKNRNGYREGHFILYKYYVEKSPNTPQTIQDVLPLTYAVYHGCRAGKQRQAFRQVFCERLRSGQDLAEKLGAIGTGLSILANFYEEPWTRPDPGLSWSDRSSVLSNTGFFLRCLGRLEEALRPTESGADLLATANDWQSAAIAHRNLSEIHIITGNIQEGIAAGRRGVDFADRSGHLFERMAERAALADALHQAGELAEAEALLNQAEQFQASRDPGNPTLYSLQGYRYCDLLLDRGQSSDVIRRARQGLRIAQRNRWPQDIGLDHLSLGRAHQPDSAERMEHLDQAVQFLRLSGMLEFLVLALLTRALPHDLEEAFRIASRSKMRLCLADYYLSCSRISFASGEIEAAAKHLGSAERLIVETGYHRRDFELASLRANLKG